MSEFTLAQASPLTPFIIVEYDSFKIAEVQAEATNKVVRDIFFLTFNFGPFCQPLTFRYRASGDFLSLTSACCGELFILKNKSLICQKCNKLWAYNKETSFGCTILRSSNVENSVGQWLRGNIGLLPGELVLSEVVLWLEVFAEWLQGVNSFFTKNMSPESGVEFYDAVAAHASGAIKTEGRFSPIIKLPFPHL